MKQDVLIGIDAGSTHLKAGIFDLSCNLIEIHHQRVHVYHSTPGCSEFDAEEIFLDLSIILKKVMSSGKYNPLAIGISSFGEAVVPIRADGSVLSRMITWYDMRGQNDILNFAELLGIENLYRKTGQYASGKFTLSKLLWMQRVQPRLLADTYKFLFMQDYLAYRLTGNIRTDYSLASRSMLCDIENLSWSSEIAEASSLPLSLFPEIIASGESAGAVSAEGSEATNIPEGIPVVFAGHDHASASVAADIQGRQIAVDSLGTSETCVTSGPPGDLKTLFDRNIAFYPYCDFENRFLSSIQGCGGAIEWLTNLLFKKDEYALFFSHANEMTAAPEECPVFIPFLKGIQEIPGLYGMIHGLKDQHHKEHLCYSLLEGLCFEYRRRLEQIEAATNKHFNSIRATGRLSAEPVFMQLKSDVIKRPVEVPAFHEAVCLGAAVLAGKKIGFLSDWKPTISHTYYPNDENSGKLSDRYDLYLKMVADSRPAIQA